MMKIWILLYKSGREFAFAKPFSWVRFFCRLKGHPRGPIYYRSSGDEPDWRCKDCGDYIG